MDGLQPEHDRRRAPATCERILKHIAGHRINMHCTITRELLQRPSYLGDFADSWSKREEVQKIVLNNGGLLTSTGFMKGGIAFGVLLAFLLASCGSVGNPGGSPNSTSMPESTGIVVLSGAGDIAQCNNLAGAEATAKLLDDIPGVIFAAGDLAYTGWIWRFLPDETKGFARCYGPTWGRHKARTRPALGNREYHIPGASGYFNYFGAAAGDPQKGYYSHDLGAWHVVVINSNCSQVGGCNAGSPQEQWVRRDLVPIRLAAWWPTGTTPSSAPAHTAITWR